MIVGRLNKRVRVLEATTTRGTAGEALPGWREVADRWAAIEPLGGQELQRAQAMEQQASVRVRLRYLAGLTSRHRLVRGSGASEVVYEIVSVSAFRENGRELELLCNVITGRTP